MRKWFEQSSPDRERLLANRWLRPVSHRLTHLEIWHFNRRNVARGNLLVAAMATLITNPFTFQRFITRRSGRVLSCRSLFTMGAARRRTLENP